MFIFSRQYIYEKYGAEAPRSGGEAQDEDRHRGVPGAQGQGCLPLLHEEYGGERHRGAVKIRGHTLLPVQSEHREVGGPLRAAHPCQPDLQGHQTEGNQRLFSAIVYRLERKILKRNYLYFFIDIKI